MLAWFNKQSRLVQILLLLIPVVNWVVEVCVRWGAYLKHKDLLHLVIAIIVTLPIGIGFGWLDLVWVLIFNHLILAK